MSKTVPHRSLLGEAIRLHRKRMGLTQEQLAELAELSVPYVSEVERGRKTISVDALYRISTALGVRLATLLKDVPVGPKAKRIARRVARR